jgi:hypothetical protein
MSKFGFVSSVFFPPTTPTSSHYNALLGVILPAALPDLSIPRRRNIHWCPSANGSADGGKALLRAIIARIGGFDVPDIGFEDIPPASDAHLGEVANSVLRFDVA